MIVEPNDHPSGTLGVKFFPGATAPGGGFNDIVHVKVSTNPPVEGVSVFLKALDPDDPSANNDRVGHAMKTYPIKSLCVIESACAVILAVGFSHALYAQAPAASPGVVHDVDGVEVIRSGPIAVELGLGQEACLAGENFVLTVRFKNTTEEPVVLRGFAIETAIPYTWLRMDDGAFRRVMRIHPGDVHVPPRGQSETVLKGADSMAFDLFLAKGQLVVPLNNDTSRENAVHLSIVICPVLRMVNGEDETPIAVESNMVKVTLGPPTRRQRDALGYLADFWGMPRADHRPAEKRYREFLQQYPDVPYAAIVRASLVGAVGNDLDELEQDVFAEDLVLQDSIDFCLDKGLPFVNPLLTSQYGSFFREAQQWSRLERAAKELANVSDYDRRFHQAQAYFGMSVVRLSRQASPDHGSDWQPKLEPVLLLCLEHALTRGDEYARQIAPRVLSGLADLREWKPLQRAAALVLKSDPHDKKAIEALRLARAGLGQRSD